MSLIVIEPIRMLSAIVYTAISFHERVNVCILGVSKFLSMVTGFDNGETNNKLMLYLY